MDEKNFERENRKKLIISLIYFSFAIILMLTIIFQFSRRGDYIWVIIEIIGIIIAILGICYTIYNYIKVKRFPKKPVSLEEEKRIKRRNNIITIILLVSMVLVMIIVTIFYI